MLADLCNKPSSASCRAATLFFSCSQWKRISVSLAVSFLLSSAVISDNALTAALSRHPCNLTFLWILYLERLKHPSNTQFVSKHWNIRFNVFVFLNAHKHTSNLLSKHWNSFSLSWKPSARAPPVGQFNHIRKIIKFWTWLQKCTRTILWLTSDVNL